MANLVIVCGPQAVGKMTVAESLRDKLRYNMMMNHDSIEMSDKIFGFGTPAQKEFNAIFTDKSSTDFLIILAPLRKCRNCLEYQAFPAFCVSEDTPHIMAFRSLIWR